MTSMHRSARTFLILLGSFLFAATLPASAELKFKRIETQYIAALGDVSANHGTGAEEWGLWTVDPGPRGVQLRSSAEFLLKGVAPAGWTFDANDWWLEEFGRIMEKPQFPIPAGRYVVTNGQFFAAVLTIHEKDAAGHMAWELSEGATLASVTHQGCRAGRYRPETAGATCTPARVAPEQFPVLPGAAMPPAHYCSKQDYQVLIVVGVADEAS